MKRKLYIALKILLVLMIIAGITAISLKTMDYRKGEQSYAQAVKEAGLSRWSEVSDKTPGEMPGQADVREPEEEIETDLYALALSEMDLEALRQTNPDVVGWIAIPETDIFYPIVQTGDNTYYLNHTWQKTRSSVGAIFLEQYSSPELNDFNTLIYGHKMRDGSMFGVLSSYQNMDYWKEHPSVYLVDDKEVYRYDIFAAYEVGVREIIYRLDLEERELQQEFIRFSLEHSNIDTGIVPEVSEKIVTLSTCTGRGHATRFVVQAVRRSEMSRDEGKQ